MPFLPKDVARSCLRRARRYLDLAAHKVPDSRVKNDLRRMALVMTVTAIESYMHGIVVRRIADVRRRADLPKSLARLEIPFLELADLADASISAQRKGRTTRPWVRVKASLQRRLLSMTFQSYDQVSTAFAIAGVDKAWSKVASELGETPGDIRDRLNTLVRHRNHIVHEGDLQRALRPRQLRLNKINHSDTTNDIDWVESLVDAMDKVVTNVA